ncbi:MAG: tetratricopeptide repeat protein [Pseudomonadota bacterium]
MILTLAILALLPHVARAQDDKSAHPLLQLARERVLKGGVQRGAPGVSGVREAEHQLAQAKAPPDEQCAGSLGATAFADLHGEVAAARSGEGDFAGAAAAYRSAHACRPRDANILAALAGVLFDARDYAGAREAINASLVIDARVISTNRIAGNIDFVAERWADAIGRFHYVASGDIDRTMAGYGQLMYWLAQARAGMAKPQFVTRTPGTGWPQPLLLYMSGEFTEAELLVPIEDGDRAGNEQPNTSTDERLCEALFYVGEAYWARGEPTVARDYFAALVNLKVLYFLEHGLALAEIAKLRSR